MSVSEKYLKDYKVVDYQNPRLRKKMQEQRKRGALAFFSIFFVVLAGLFYFFFLSPFFLIKNINVESETVAPEAALEKAEEQMAQKFLFVFSRRNIWVFSVEKFVDAISKDYFWDELLVEKIYPNEVHIVLREKVTVMRWLNAGQCYKIDAVGLIIGFCGETAPLEGVIEVRDLRAGSIALPLGKTVATAEDLKYVRELSQGFTKALNLEVKSYEFSVVPKEFKVYLKQGAEIYLNMDKTASEIIAKLNVLLDKEIGRDKLGKVGYIDMRFGEKIYYQ